MHKKLSNLDLAKEAALLRFNSFEEGGIMNEYKDNEDKVIGYKVIPPINLEENVIVYKI